MHVGEKADRNLDLHLYQRELCTDVMTVQNWLIKHYTLVQTKLLEGAL